MATEVTVTSTQEVNFNGTSLVAVMHNGEPHVAIKPLCEAIGLDWNGQYQRIIRDEILNQGMCVIHIPCSGADGKTYNSETVTLPLKYLNGWMFGVDNKRVSEEIRPVLLKYKLECYDVLNRHFTKKAAIKIRKVELSYPEMKADFEQTLQDALALGYTRTEALQRANLAYQQATGYDWGQMIGFPDFSLNNKSKFTTLPEFAQQINTDYIKVKKWIVPALQHLGLLTKDEKPKPSTAGEWHSTNHDSHLEDIGWDNVTIEHLHNVSLIRQTTGLKLSRF